MASGSFTGTTTNKYITPKITWNSAPDVAGNFSVVTATLAYAKSAASTAATYGTLAYSLTINGVTTSGSKSVTLSTNGSYLTIVTATVEVPHNSNGSKSITISATGGISGTSFTSTTCSATVTLDTIPRASTITVPSFTMGTAGTIAITKADSSFTHTLTWKFGSASGTIATKATAASVSWTPAIDTLAPEIPNATSGTGTITCDTYSGSTKIGSVSKSFTATIPASVVPTISGITVTEATSGLATQFGAFVQSKSTLKTAVSASGIYGSTISSYSTTFNGKTYSGSSFTTSVPTSSGNLTMKTTVKDSRGRSATYSKTITIVAYANPAINAFSVKRCDAAGTAQNDGEYVSISYQYTVAPVGDKNTVTAVVQYKRSDATTWNGLTTVTDGYASALTVVPETLLSAEYKWDIRLTVADYFSSTTKTSLLPTASVILDLLASGDGIAFGKVAELASLLESGWNIQVTKSVAPEIIVTDGMKAISLGIDSGGINRGLYDKGDGMWLLYYNGTSLVSPKPLILTDTFSVEGTISAPMLIQCGKISITPSASNTPTSGTVTFDTPFPGTPVVVATPSSNVPGTKMLGVGVTAVSRTGCNIWMNRADVVATTVFWIAVYTP